MPRFRSLLACSAQDRVKTPVSLVFEYSNKIVSFDFSSWDPLPWVESWDVSFYGNEGVLHTRPLPATCELFLKEAKGRFNAGWTRWNETSFPIAWASEKTEYTPELAEIGNLHFFRREVESFVAAALGRTAGRNPRCSRPRHSEIDHRLLRVVGSRGTRSSAQLERPLTKSLDGYSTSRNCFDRSRPNRTASREKYGEKSPCPSSLRTRARQGTGKEHR